MWIFGWLEPGRLACRQSRAGISDIRVGIGRMFTQRSVSPLIHENQGQRAREPDRPRDPDDEGLRESAGSNRDREKVHAPGSYSNEQKCVCRVQVFGTCETVITFHKCLADRPLKRPFELLEVEIIKEMFTEVYV